MAREQFQNLTEPMYYILLVLAEERHGYDIMKSITEMTDGLVNVGPGTLYPLLSRFQKEDLILQVSEDSRKKTYILTEKGRNLLTEEFNRLKRLVEDGAVIMGGEDLSIKMSGKEKRLPLADETAKPLEEYPEETIESNKIEEKKKKRFRKNEELFF